MTDRPILIPTSKGPVGAIVSEPEGVPRAALIFFQGGGPPARWGINAIWTRIAHRIAALGILVLRFDFACEADSLLAGMDAAKGPAWRSAVDLPITREVAAWFSERTGMGLLVAGACYGGRLGLEVAAEDERIEEVFLVTPYLSGVRRRRAKTREPSPREKALAEKPNPPQNQNDRLSAVAVESSQAVVERGVPLWILIGEKDDRQALELQERLSAGGDSVPEVEVAADVALHPGTDPLSQELIAERMVERVSRALREREASV